MRQSRWPRIHLVYFALASLDILAILAGLWLSHELISSHRVALAQSAKIERSMTLVRDISDRLTDAQGDLVDAVYSAKLTHQKDSFDTKIILARQNLSRIREELGDAATEKALVRLSGMITRMERVLQLFIDQANTSFTLAATDRWGAIASVRISQSRYSTLRQNIRDINQYLAVIQTASRAGAADKLQSLTTYEKGIAALIGLIVACVIFYGHFVGALMKRKFIELETALGHSEEAEKSAKTAADELQAVNDEIARLNRDLADNVQALRDAQNEIVRKGRMEQLGRLTATIAHEIRNPLGTVRTSAFLLERRVKEKGLGLETQISRINRGIERCDNIITQLLDFSRNKPLKCEPSDLDTWLEQMVIEEANRLPEAVAISCELGLGGHKVPFDPARLQRAVGNLMSNACEAMVGQGDDPQKFTTPEPRVTIASAFADGGITISVTDNGPGISAEIIDKIREPLYTTKSFGTGLGIPAVEQIATQHQGRLEITSASGNGATFTIWLPSESEKQSAA